MHTKAKAQIAENGRSVKLARDGWAKFAARLLEPTGARFEYVEAPAQPPRLPEVEAAKRPSMPKLVVRLKDVTEGGITVLFSSDDAFEAAIEPLDRWIERGDRP